MKIILSTAAIVSLAIGAFADIQDPPGNDYGPTRKLGRGISNLVIAPTEFFVTVNEEAVSGEEPAVYLEAAYKIARALVITSARKQEAEELDFDMLASEIDGIIQQVSRLSEIGTKVKTIRNNSDWIEKQVADLQGELETKFSQMSRRIRAAVGN